MFENLEENLEQENKREFRARLKRGIVIAGLCASFIVGTIIYGINNKFKPHILRFSDFISIEKKYSDNKEIIYTAYKDGKEDLTIKQKGYRIDFEDKDRNGEFERIELKFQINKYTEHIILYPEDYLNYPPFNRLGKQKLGEIRKNFKEAIPFEKIRKKIE